MRTRFSRKTMTTSAITIAVVVCGLGACSLLPKPPVILTPVVSPMVDLSDWKPVNAGINPAFHRYESALGTINFYDRPEVMSSQNSSEFQDIYTTLKVEMLQSLLSAGHQLVTEPVDETLALAGVDFRHSIIRTKVDGPTAQRLRTEIFLGEIHRRPVQIIVSLNDDPDSKSYEALQELLVQHIQRRVEAPSQR